MVHKPLLPKTEKSSQTDTVPDKDFFVNLSNVTTHDESINAEQVHLQMLTGGTGSDPPSRHANKLERLVELQTGMMQRNATPLFDLSKPLGHAAKLAIIHWIGEFTKALIHEAIETENWFPWKHWSLQLGNKSPIAPWSPEHIMEVRVEVIDQLHFVLSQAILLGMDADMIYDLYVGKAEINKNRLESGSY